MFRNCRVSVRVLLYQKVSDLLLDICLAMKILNHLFKHSVMGANISLLIPASSTFNRFWRCVMSERTGDLLNGLLIGGFIGAVVGILYAPKSGKETREDIVRTTEAAYEAAVKSLKDLELSAKEKVQELGEKVTEFSQHSVETIQDNKKRLKKAIGAGVEAYQGRKN
jgi:gas vesicle protein